MAKVLMLDSVVGKDIDWQPGQVIEMSEADAAKWADGIRAKRVDEQPRKHRPKSK
jgi:hypothetical protein